MSFLISIIIPIYNAEVFIERCLKSVFNQVYHNWELILVDDGSTDNSLKKCEKYVTSNVHLYHKSNGGVSSARNFGLKKCSGNYVVFVDVDDYLEENYLFNLVSNIEKNDLVVAGYNEVYSSGKIQKIVFSVPHIVNHSYLKNKFNELYVSNFFNSPFNKIYKKSLITFEFNEQQSLGEDLLFNLNYIQKCSSIAVINFCDYNYCINNSSATNRYNPLAIDNYYTIKKTLYKFCENMKIPNYEEIENVFILNVLGNLQLLIESNDYKISFKIKKIKEIFIEILNQYNSIKLKTTFMNKIIIYLLRHKGNVLIYIILRLRYYLKIVYRKLINMKGFLR